MRPERQVGGEVADGGGELEAVAREAGEHREGAVAVDHEVLVGGERVGAGRGAAESASTPGTQSRT